MAGVGGASQRYLRMHAEACARVYLDDDDDDDDDGRRPSR